MGCSASIVSSKGSSHSYRKTSARTNRQRHRKLILEKQRKQTDQPLPFTTGKYFVKNGTVKSGTQESRDKSKELFMHEALLAHNQLRALHGVPEFKLCKTLTEHAQVWADNIAHTNMTIHSSCKLPSGETIGENIYTCWSSFGNNEAKAGDAVRSWYGESALYDYDKASFSYKTGHFTQVIWKDSISMGMAWSRANDDTIYVVANYLPAGNVQGLFGQNVLRPIYVLSTSYLRPIYVLSTSYLRPIYVLSTSYLRPIYVLSTSYLRPIYVLSTSYLRPIYVLSTSYLRPIYVLSTSYLRPIYVLSTSYLRPIYVLSTSYLRPIYVLSTSYHWRKQQ